VEYSIRYNGYKKISLDEVLHTSEEKGEKLDFMFARQIASFNIETLYKKSILISESNNDWIKFYHSDADTIDKINEYYIEEGLKLLLKIL